MSDGISPEDIAGVLDTETAIPKSEIIDRLVDTDERCPECGRRTAETKRARRIATEQVDAALRNLMGKHQIVTTPEWNYRLARRAEK